MNLPTTQSGDLPFVLRMSVKPGDEEATSTEFRSGDLCPACLQGRLEYNGLLNLECGECRYTVGGCFT